MKKLQLKTRKNIGLVLHTLGMVLFGLLPLSTLLQAAYLGEDFFECILAHQFKTYTAMYDILHFIIFVAITIGGAIYWFRLYDNRKEFITAWDKILRRHRESAE